MDDLTTLLKEVDFTSIILSVVLFGVCLKFVVELVEWIFNKFGVEFKGKREEKAQKLLLADTSEKVSSLCSSVKRLCEAQENLANRIEAVEAENIKYRQSDTRNEIIKQYRYFCNDHCNPMKAWTEVEHDSFKQLYDVYASNKGNSYVHDVVFPAMENLEVIELTNTSKLAQLYSTRSQMNE